MLVVAFVVDVVAELVSDVVDVDVAVPTDADDVGPSSNVIAPVV